jgi:hypothetical protein
MKDKTRGDTTREEKRREEKRRPTQDWAKTWLDAVPKGTSLGNDKTKPDNPRTIQDKDKRRTRQDKTKPDKPIYLEGGMPLCFL